MINYEFKYGKTTFKRVTRKTWLKFANNNPDKLFALCPNNLRPGEPWNPQVITSKSAIEENLETITTFENSFHYYNCSNKETGYYISYFIPV